MASLFELLFAAAEPFRRGVKGAGEALGEDLAAGRDAFVANMQRAAGVGALGEDETDSDARARAGLNLAGLTMTGAMPGGVFAAPQAGATLGAGFIMPKPRTGLFDLVRPEGVLPDVTQAPVVRGIPAKGPSARVEDVLDSRKVRNSMSRYIDEGVKEGGADWYWTEPLRARYIEQLGERDGNAAFSDFIHYIAATSPGNKVPKNIQTASYYATRARQGLDPELPPKGSGFGAKTQNLHLQNAERYAADTWDPLQNPKPISFAQNLLGNWLPATVDTHAVRLPGMESRDPRWLAGAMTDKAADGTKTKLNPRGLFDEGLLTIEEARKRPTFWESVPSAKTEYGPLEGLYAEIGRRKGLTPAETQGAAWVGARRLTGMDSPPLPFMEVFDEVLRQSAGNLGVEPSQLLRDFIAGRADLPGKLDMSKFKR